MTSKPKTRRKSTRLLSHTRPLLPLTSNSGTGLSSKATRTLIRSHHTLHKKLRQAELSGNHDLVQDLKAQIEEQGGLAKYQHASIVGQSARRGGDSSKVLVDWLYELEPNIKTLCKQTSLRLLEVGALSIDNACSKCGLFNVERIDLNSQHAGILQQDFMERPLPSDEIGSTDQFDVVSLSLVINYVSDPVGRGDMLRRVGTFLRQSTTADTFTTQPRHDLFPGLFLVLPSPCVTNSRYLDQEKMEAILDHLDYDIVKQKLSSKLVYYYLRFRGSKTEHLGSFPKKELRKGGKRNNFAIVLQ